MRRRPALAAALAALLLALPATGLPAMAQDRQSRLEDLGARLFFDVNLSANRSQSCASCHDPARAFSDPRGAASVGDDGVSLGDRNAPTAMYARFVPPLAQLATGDWAGGLFHDGRAPTLEDQAAGPPLNPVEMGMKDAAAIQSRLREDPGYQRDFPALFGAGILDEPEGAFAAMTQAIAAFERADSFAPFTSRYDRWLRGEIALTPQEELGRVLFFSQQFTNCSLCHRGGGAMDPRETFTDHRHHNIGTPENLALRAMNGVPPGTVDAGLGAIVDDPAMLGAFRTPTLRNVAVTGPYMHNGVFGDLRTVIAFYNRYNSRAEAAQINPETGAPFGPAPLPQTLALSELEHGPALDAHRIAALEAFLRALTDAEFEHLLPAMP